MQLTTLNQDKERSDKNKKNDGLNIINNITNNYIYLNKQNKGTAPNKDEQKQAPQTLKPAAASITKVDKVNQQVSSIFNETRKTINQ